MTTTPLNIKRTTDGLDIATTQVEESAYNLALIIQKTGPVPAPAAYTALGNLKVALWRLRDATNQLQDGIRRFHDRTDLHITDEDPFTGEPRDPAESLELAASQLRAISNNLADAASSTDIAQEAIAGQGYELNK